MPRFFTQKENINEKILLTGEDVRHIGMVLRHKIGDIITVCDGDKTDYKCKIESITKTEVELAILEKSESSEPLYKAVLFQGLPKGDKAEIIIQKATELGVSRIVFFCSERCITKIDEASAKSKLSRWQGISLSAAKQSGRGIIPQIEYVSSFEKALDYMKSLEKCILFYEGENTVFAKQLISNENFSEIGFMIGPEGGFSQKEIETARSKNIALGGLGKLILRTETASGCFLSMLLYEKC